MSATDALFHALANPARRKILDIVRASPGCSVNELAAHFEMSRIGVMKHLRLLERAELILSVKEGRTRQLYFNVMPIRTIYDRWTDEYSDLWADRLSQLKARIEGREVESPPAAQPLSPRSNTTTEDP